MNWLLTLYSIVSLLPAASGQACVDPRDFGAVEGNADDGLGDYWESNTAAIQAAIDKAGNASTLDNRQCVIITGGDFITASISLRSNIKLIIDEGSRLITAANRTTLGMVTGKDIENVEITGPGVLYGNAEHYISYYDPIDDRYEPISTDGSRPRVIYFETSKNIYLHHIKVQNASDWNVHFKGCQNISVDYVSIYGDWRFPNNDGIDPDSCIDFTITNSDINVADDGVCPKASAGFGPLRNLVVRNVTVRSKSHALKFGSNCDEEMSDVLFENITIWDSNGGISIQQRSGGDIHNVTYRDINVETRYVAPRWWGNGEWLVMTAEKRHREDLIGRTYDITLENINAVSENGGIVSGKLHGVQGLVMRNVNVVIAQWSNYSTGEGPPCETRTTEDSEDGLNDIECMGTQDHRPSRTEDHNCEYYCRTPAKADGVYLENVQFALLDKVTVTYSSQFLTSGPPSFWGECYNADSRTSDVVKKDFECYREY